MNIFEGIPVGQSRETLADAMAIIANRLSTIEPPRSLCELHLDAEDCQWLYDWASAIEPRTLEMLVKDNGLIIRNRAPLSNFTSWKDAFGCMFLLIASETVRREAPESSLWPYVVARFSPGVRSIYFADSSYPDASIRGAMDGAIRQMKLRHVLDENDMQQYFVSTCLQFGFTRQGMSNLAGWLVGQPSTRAVQLLRGEFGEMKSESFLAMWSALRNYRNGNISEARARSVLEISSWVLPEWIDGALEQATKRLPARYHSREDDGLDIFGNADDQTLDRRQRRRRADRFLTRPALRWDGAAAPRFESSVINLNRLGLTTDRYTIRNDSGVLAYILRADDGAYKCSQEEITIPSDTPYVHLSLSDDYGETHLSQQFDLWDVTEDVEMFDLRNGNRLDPYEVELREDAHYGLFVSPDLRVEPGDLPFASVGIGGERKIFVRFRPDECGAVSVLLDEIELWNYSPERKITSARKDEEEPPWATAVSPRMPYRASSSPVGEEQYLFEVIVSGREVSLVAVRLGNIQLGVDHASGIYRTERFDLLNFIKPVRGVPGSYEAVFKLVLKFGNDHSQITRTFDSGMTGVLYVDSERKRRMLNAQDRLSAREANTTSYEFLLPPQALDKFDGLRLVEGQRIVRRLRHRAAPLGDLAGYGERLWVSDEHMQTNYLTLSDETYDSGILIGASGHRAGEPTRILLAHDIEPGTGHSIVLWEFGKQVQIQQAKEVVTNSDNPLSQWNVDCDDMATPALIALAYHGELIGSHWVRSPSVPMFGANEDSALLTLAMLRWGQAPLLSQDWNDMTADLARRYAEAVLGAWIESGGLPKGLKQKPADSYWYYVMRQLQ